MKKLSLYLFMLGFFVLTWIPLSYAADGKEVFINKCGSCHKSEGEARMFAPTKYASVQWERYFARNKHKRRKDIGSLFTEAELNAVKEYLIDHAADSEQPEAVGLRLR